MYDFSGTNESAENANGLAAGADNDEITISCAVIVDSRSLAQHQVWITGPDIAPGPDRQLRVVAPTGGGDFRFEVYRYHSSSGGVWQVDTDFSFATLYIVVVKDDKSSDTNNPVVNINGTEYSVGSGLTETTTPSGTKRTGVDSIIFGENLGHGNDFDGKIGWAAHYSSGLSSANMAALGRGDDPEGISGLIHFWPMNADLNDTVGTANLTANGSPVAYPAVFTPFGSISFTGLAPTAFVDTVADIPLGAISFSGHVPTAGVDQIVSVPLGAISFSGFAPTAFVDAVATVPLGAVSFTTFAPDFAGPVWSAEADITTSWSPKSDQSTTWTPE